MGSLTSRPKLPSVQQQPQIIYLPTSLPQPAITPSVPTTPSAPASPSASEQVAVREKNLLTASRGRLGTVTTSFRGLLGLASGAGQRKTLLGE